MNTGTQSFEKFTTLNTYKTKNKASIQEVRKRTFN